MGVQRQAEPQTKETQWYCSWARKMTTTTESRKILDIHVGTKYPLTSITLTYRVLKFRAHRDHVVLKSGTLTKSWFSIRLRARARLTCKQVRVVRKGVVRKGVVQRRPIKLTPDKREFWCEFCNYSEVLCILFSFLFLSFIKIHK